MRRVLLLLPAGLLLAFGCSDEKKREPVYPPSAPKPAGTPREQYDSLLHEMQAQQMGLGMQMQRAQGEEQQKLIQRSMNLGNEFADRFYQLAEDNPNDPVATDALFWVVQNAPGSAAYQKALDKVTGQIKDMPMKDLAARLNMMHSGNPKIFEIIIERAEQDEKEPESADLLAWVATRGGLLPIGQKATDRIIEKYPNHDAMGRLCQVLERSNAPKATESLKQILEKSPSTRIKGTAALALGNRLAAKADQSAGNQAEADKLAAEAEKYLVMIVDQFGKDNAVLKGQAEGALKILRTLRVGKEAPDIVAADLDGKDFKLSDYRGKVVLLDFWGNW